MTYLTYALINKDYDYRKVIKKLDRLLEKYDQNIDKPEIEECYCKDRIAQRDAYYEGYKAVSYEDKKKLWWQTTLSYYKEPWSECTQEFLENSWTSYFKNNDSKALSVYNSHPLKGKFNPDCLECKGKGYVRVYLNKQAKWNRYQLGGRYTGCLWGLDNSTRDEFADSLLENMIPVDWWLENPNKLFPYAVVSREFWVNNEDCADNWEELVLEYLGQHKENGMLVSLEVHL